MNLITQLTARLEAVEDKVSEHEALLKELLEDAMDDSLEGEED